MYWRIKKIRPDQIARQYWVHAALVVSVLFNVGIGTKLAANSKGLNGGMKTDFENFARNVTLHLFDANYLTVNDSMAQLKGELHGPCYQKMVQMGLIPPSPEELRAVERQMNESKSVSCIKFDEVKLANEPGPTTPAIMSVLCKVVVHDSQGVRPAAFKLQYKLGQKIIDKQTNQTRPIVIDATVQEAPMNDGTPPPQ